MSGSRTQPPSKLPYQIAPFLFFFTTTRISRMTLIRAPATQEPCVDYDALQRPLAVLYSIIFVLGLLGNLVALWVFFCVHSKKNSVRVYLINVAFADLLLVVCLPFRILYHSQGNRWNLGPTLCKVVGNVFYMNMYISITLLGLISVDRYLKINRVAGTQHRLQSTVWSTAICATIWIVATAMTSTFLMPRNNSSSKNESFLGIMSKNDSEFNRLVTALIRISVLSDESSSLASLCPLLIASMSDLYMFSRCFHYKKLEDSKWKAYINVLLLFVFWLTFISLVVSYGKIALKLLRTSQDKPHLPNAHHYTRTARKSFFILILFTVCFVPYHTVRMFYINTQITDTSCFWMGVVDKVNEIALIFSALNTCLDPVMFFLLSSSVRKEVLRLVSNVLCGRDVGVVSGSSSTGELEGRTGRPERGQATIQG